MRTNLPRLLGLALLLALSACQNGVKAGHPAATDTVVGTAPAPPTEPVSTAVAAEHEEPVGQLPPTVIEAAPVETLSDPAMTGIGPPPPPMSSGREVFARLAARLSAPACVSGESNESWRRRIAGNPDRFARQLQDALPLLAYVLAEVERRELPGEFALIPFIESGYRPDARGAGGPTGLWQMIGTTARNHGVHQVPGYDGRLSPIESTQAALSYLQTLQTMFDDWRAVVMAYNAGEGRLLRAFRQSDNRQISSERRLPHGLSPITYDYVAKLHALSCLIAEPERAQVRLPLDATFTPLQALPIADNARSVDAVALDHGLDASELRWLNPAYRNGKIGANVPRALLAPASGVAPGVASVAVGAPVAAVTSAGDDPPANTTSHTVRDGDTAWSIARRYGLSLRQLFRLNGLDPRSVLRPGQILKLIP